MSVPTLLKVTKLLNPPLAYVVGEAISKKVTKTKKNNPQ
jgi:hypothetical protein